MEIVLKNNRSKYLEIFSLLDLDNIHETFKRFSSIKEPLDATIFAVNETISSHQLSNLKFPLLLIKLTLTILPFLLIDNLRSQTKPS